MSTPLLLVPQFAFCTLAFCSAEACLSHLDPRSIKLRVVRHSYTEGCLYSTTSEIVGTHHHGVPTGLLAATIPEVFRSYRSLDQDASDKFVCTNSLYRTLLTVARGSLLFGQHR